MMMECQSLMLSQEIEMLNFDNYRLGHRIVDDQHEGLFHQLRTLLTLCYDQGSNLRELLITDVLKALATYAEIHFATEELMMEEHGYPEEETTLHKNAHRLFTERYGRLVDGANSRVDVQSLAKYLVGWLEVHISVDDRHLVEFIKAKEQSC